MVDEKDRTFDTNGSSRLFDNQIMAIMFCEFDNREGPKILYQTNETICRATFDSISGYLIPKDQLKNHIITITVGKYKICGYPIHIDDIKYCRNKYMFNICFIFDHSVNTCSYEAVVKKLATDLRTLEIESKFLSNAKMKMNDMPKILRQIREDLNTKGECIIQKIADLEHSAIFLKLILNHKDPQVVQSFDVPVFIVDMQYFQIEDWDYLTRIIVHSINGFKTVSMIANETKIETIVVKESIKNLIYEQVLMLVPIIQYSSLFVKTPTLAFFYSNKEIKSECARFCTLNKDAEPPSFYELFTFYNSFNYGVTVQDFNEVFKPHTKNIDLKKAILFGLIKGFLRKINKYPVTIQDSQTKSESSKICFTGVHSYDKICSSLGISVKTVEENLEKDFSVVICIR